MRDHETFKETCNTLLEWLKIKKTTIQCLVSTHGTKEQMVEKLQKLLSIQNDLSEGKRIILKFILQLLLIIHVLIIITNVFN